MNQSANTHRIARNTLLLYGRMAVMMVVAIWAGSKVLEVLGVEDNNIYALVGSFIALFGFLNNAMAAATQRFLNVEMEGGANVRQVFSTSLMIHAVIAATVLVLGETVGLWFVNEKLVLPPERMTAALWVYHLSLLTAAFNIVRVPYNAIIVASERMSMYALLTIAEAVLRLATVFTLIIIPGDKLIAYGILMCVVVLAVTLVYRWYCVRKFPECRWQRPQSGDLARRMIGFSGWSLLGSGAVATQQQGTNILFNIMVSTSPLNVAIEKASNLSTAVYSFVSSFQTAFAPAMMKSWAGGDEGYFQYLIFRASKYSYYLLLILSLPFIVCAEPLIGLWLAPTTVPAHTVSFAQLLMVNMLIDALAGPLWSAVQATGRIRGYQIMISSLILITLPLSWLCLRLGMAPESALVVRIAVNAVCLTSRAIYMRRRMAFPAGRYFVAVVAVVVGVTALAGVVPWLLVRWSVSLWWAAAAAAVWTPVVIYAVGMRRSERNYLTQMIWSVKRKLTNSTG